jgi:hypothetical protein
MTGEELLAIVRRLNEQACGHGEIVLQDEGITIDVLAAAITEKFAKPALDRQTAFGIVKAEVSRWFSPERQTVAANCAMMALDALLMEMTFFARVSAGYSPTKHCVSCDGPVEDDPPNRTMCIKCHRKKRIADLELEVCELARERERLLAEFELLRIEPLRTRTASRSDDPGIQHGRQMG